jgi:hypothetical protein
MLTYSHVGWLCAITWQAAASGPVFLSATMIQGLIVLNHPNTYVPKQWHGSLLMLAFLSVCIIFNTFLAKRLPIVERLFVVVHILGIFIFVPLGSIANGGRRRLPAYRVLQPRRMVELWCSYPGWLPCPGYRLDWL